MSLLKTLTDYSVDSKAERAAFEAAMTERLSKAPGYKMADLMWDMYLCEKRIQALENGEMAKQMLKCCREVGKGTRRRGPNKPKPKSDNDWGPDHD